MRGPRLNSTLGSDECARDLFEAACRVGAWEGCHSLAVLFVSDEPSKPNPLDCLL